MVGVLDHQVNIERQFGFFPNKADDRRAEGNVVDEMSVHNVAMDPVRACLFDLANFFAQTRKIGCQNRGSDEDLGHASIYIKSLTTRTGVSCYGVSAR